ncbi:protein of unknown function [Nitrosotalea devaniterrae]|uniref:Uncharacterized protein n=1 Tax=Nitrosotalea devaniterrae TaxID=1078905 RepID=A0A128A154_9ARCH|nr:protein of unknown function [Candidatus Nitrosotalea devanaterra]
MSKTVFTSPNTSIRLPKKRMTIIPNFFNIIRSNSHYVLNRSISPCPD